MKLTYLQHHQIDKKKWDSVIENAQNGLIYALSWYLDIVSPRWDAIIADDYKYVMPLTIKKDNEGSHFYKPAFLQFLGVFGNNLTEEILNTFVKETKEKVDSIDTWFNPGNKLVEGENCIKRRTQVLSLNKSYQSLYTGYNRSNKQNLKKARKANLMVRHNENANALVSTFKQMYRTKKVEGFNINDYKNLEKLVRFAHNNQMAEFYSVYDKEEICSIALFIKWKDRYTIYCATSYLGREKRSVFLLIDQFIKDHCEQNAILDFAGSNIPGVAYMNKGFGAVDLNYFALKT